MALWEVDLLWTCNIVQGLIFVISTALNLLVFLVFYKRRGLKKLSNRFVMNMSAVNLVSCWSLSLLSVNSPTSEAGCVAGRGLACGVCAATVLSVLLIGFDQYLAIVQPLHYATGITCLRPLHLLSLCWMLSAAVGLAGATSASGWPCSSVQPSSRICANIFAIFFFAIVFLLPFLLLCWMYVSIYCAARNNSRKHTPDYAFINAQPKANPYFDVHSLRHRIYNASFFRYREEARAGRVSALVIGTAFACWLPFSMMIVLESPLLGQVVLSPLLCRTGVTLLAMSSVLSALLFAHRNQRIRNDIRKIFGLNKTPSNTIVRGIVADATHFHVLGSSFSSAASSSTDNSLAESI